MAEREMEGKMAEAGDGIMEVHQGSQIKTARSSGKTRALQMKRVFHDTWCTGSSASSCRAVHSEGLSDDG